MAEFTSSRVITRIMRPRTVRHHAPANAVVPPATAGAPAFIAAATLVTTTANRGLTIVREPIDRLRLADRKLRKPGKGQVEAAVAAITRLDFCPPLLVTADGEIIDRPEWFEACQILGRETVATICVDDLSKAEIKALRLALLKIPERATWDMEALAAELEELLAFDPTLLAVTGFTMAEIDIALAGFAPDMDDIDDVPAPSGPVVSRLGDLWTFAGGGKLLCGNAREAASYRTLLGAGCAEMVLTDPPYGCKVKGHVSRRHREFIEGSGMNEAESLVFFQSSFEAMTPHLIDGAILDVFIDHAGMFPLMQAVRNVGLQQKALVVWDKGAGGMGSLYRQQTEFVLVTKWGSAPHINNVELGKNGRNRTTLWSAPGLAQFGKDRKEALAGHPTCKPVGLLFDALLDTSRPGGIVLDPFAGSGSTLLAAQRARRLGRAIELDPAYVDVAVRRMEKLTGQPARHAKTGLTFAETAAQRAAGLAVGVSHAAQAQA